MDESHRRALDSLRFNWAPTPDDVWRPIPYHVVGLQPDAEQALRAGFKDAHNSTGSSPIGVVLAGQRGSGKTHLLGVTRAEVQRDGGFFFLVGVYDPSTFWRSVLMSILDGLERPGDGNETQLARLVRELAEYVSAPRSVRRAMTGDVPLSRAPLDAFIDLLTKKDRRLAQESQDTARALLLLLAGDKAASSVGYTYLSTNDEEEPGERAAWGIRRVRKSPQDIVRDVSSLLATAGPTLIAVDQIDVVVAQSAIGSVDGHSRDADWRESLLLEQIAGGLMALRELTKRTVTVVSCLPHTWEMIRTRATDTVGDRYRLVPVREVLSSPQAAAELLTARLTHAYQGIGFQPPSPLWPVKPGALNDATTFTPRQLLIAVDAHVRACLRGDAVVELENLIQDQDHDLGRDRRTVLSDADRARLDGRYRDLCRDAVIAPALHQDTEDAVVPGLLSAGLTAWIAEQGDAARTYSQDPAPGPKPTLHARLLCSLNRTREDEQHWAFRAIGSSTANAVLNRLRNAVTASGLTEGVSKRRLFVLRTAEFPSTPKLTEAAEAFYAAGGVRLEFPEDDIRRLVALRRLVEDEDGETLRAWFVARRPASEIGVLQAALADVDDMPAPAAVERKTPRGDGPSLVLGRGVTDGQPIEVDLAALRTHTAVFAGSGSGKTVFLRRLIEECALQGVSSIVLDPNNDLARLGDPWPEPPSTWDSVDARRAQEYLAHTEVVIWTPRRAAGRPLSFRPLPDFASLLDDPDEFSTSVDAAVAALAPRARVNQNNNRAELSRAVLRQALVHFARHGGEGLPDFIALLADLPDGVSALQNATKMARDMSQTLEAARVNDPLFGGDGEPADPSVLLTPADGKRARVSVISFVGLPEDEQRQSFVNQLQLALFAWIKRNPARDRPLGGLFVMDEAQTLAPSGAMTACTQSTLALVSQARKYGLGLVFATQAPRGLQTGIPGNSATQLFGRLNSPAYIQAAKELARAKGAEVPDIGQLTVGTFYAAVAGGTFQKIRTPACLSHHPAGPLTTEEVIERARAS